MALSPYINEQTLTTAIKNNVPLNKQGTLTQIIATNTYSVEEGLYYYKVMATDGTNNYPVASATAASATTVAGVRFSGTEGTATFDITPTGEGFSYIARPISEFYGSVNGEARLANKVYGPAGPVTVGVTGTIRAGGSGNVTAFDGATFWGAAKSLLDSSKTVKYLEVFCLVPAGVYSLMIYYTDNTHAYLVRQTLSAAQLLAYGITAVASPESGTSDSIDLTPITSTATKLVYPWFGHVDYGQSGDEYGHSGGGGD